MKSKQQSPCSKCMHWPVTSQADACTSQAYTCMYCMHCPMTSQADACSYCMGSVVWFCLRYTFISSYFEDQSYLCFILEVIDCPVSHIFVSKFCQWKYYLTEQWDFWGRILSHLWSTDKRCEWDWNVLFGILSHLGKWDGDELGGTSY